MKRSAFTLVELLVVIVVISLLAAILLPAINMAREAARRGQCITNQRNLATAMNVYSNANNGLPGYLNQLGQLPIHSWAIAVMPHIGETARYEALMGNQAIDRAIVPLSTLICPTDNPRENARLNYVVNCGPDPNITGMTEEIAIVFTLFRDRRSGLASVNTKVPIEEIPSGTSNTILLSENVDAGVWRRDVTVGNTRHHWEPLPSTPPLRDMGAIGNLGFLWANETKFDPNSATPGPRPSSRHPGVVVVAFADGRAAPVTNSFIREPIESRGDWLRALCPDNQAWIDKGLRRFPR